MNKNKQEFLKQEIIQTAQQEAVLENSEMSGISCELLGKFFEFIDAYPADSAKEWLIQSHNMTALMYRLFDEFTDFRIKRAA